MCATIPRST
uniref:Uncharacterized protein n=1 Tax=Anguilla anguilla TaxID=7936 RepID=A0A0E9QVP1_ANGAN